MIEGAAFLTFLATAVAIIVTPGAGRDSWPWAG